jgi:hypothetical protein
MFDAFLTAAMKPVQTYGKQHREGEEKTLMNPSVQHFQSAPWSINMFRTISATEFGSHGMSSRSVIKSSRSYWNKMGEDLSENSLQPANFSCQYSV